MLNKKVNKPGYTTKQIQFTENVFLTATNEHRLQARRFSYHLTIERRDELFYAARKRDQTEKRVQKAKKQTNGLPFTLKAPNPRKEEKKVDPIPS